jgi:hypothetical protein
MQAGRTLLILRFTAAPRAPTDAAYKIYEKKISQDRKVRSRRRHNGRNYDNRRFRPERSDSRYFGNRIRRRWNREARSGRLAMHVCRECSC